MESIEERYYVVTTDDISKLNMAAKLVLISGGGSLSNLSCDQQDLQRLPMAFIAAGNRDISLPVTSYWAGTIIKCHLAVQVWRLSSHFLCRCPETQCRVSYMSSTAA